MDTSSNNSSYDGYSSDNNREEEDINNEEFSNDSKQNNWRTNMIMDTVQRHMEPTGPAGMNELQKIVIRFEEKIYTASVDQQDYLRKISLKMLSLREPVSGSGNPLAVVSSSSSEKPLDSGLIMPSQLRNTSQSLALGNGNSFSPPGQSQPQQALLQQNPQGGVSASGMQSSTGFPSTLASMTNSCQSTSGHVFGIQSAMNNFTAQVLLQNAHLASAQRQLQSRQQHVAEKHQQLQAQQQLLYQQQLQHQKQLLQRQQQLLQQHQQQLQHQQQQILLKQKLQQSQPVSSIFQPQQLSLMKQAQIQGSQQSILQSAQMPIFQSLIGLSQHSVLQPAQQSGLQQTSQSSLQQHQLFGFIL